MTDFVPIHYVCTHEDARKLAFSHDRFWVSNCGCRENNKEGCKRSRIDICLMFGDYSGSSGTGKKEIPLTEVVAILEEASEKKLVTRPFRNEIDKAISDGICFCCDDCCGYFSNPEEICDKGSKIETTDMKVCNLCGDCASVCYFGARKMVDGDLAVSREDCYGCGLCVETCDLDAISLVRRG
jgi:Na+-translocating ferredoxin:NAD+ oxidoreductase subunit B